MSRKVTPYLMKAERIELEDQKSSLESQLNNPMVQEKGAVRREIRRVESRLENQSPPELKGDKLDAAVKREQELRKAITQDMQSAEEMRKCPPGAIGREIEFQRKHKENMLEWKNLRRTIDRDSDDPDLSNLERFRPKVSTLNMDNALIPGRDFNFPSPQYQANYDGIDWEARSREGGISQETDESRALREELAAIRKELAVLKSEKRSAAPKKAATEKKKINLSDEERERRRERGRQLAALRKTRLIQEA